MCQRPQTGQAVTKWTHNHCPKPEVDCTTLWYNTRWQRLIYDTGHYGNNFIQTNITDRGGYGVKVTRLFGHFLGYDFTKSPVTSWNSAKTVPDNSAGLVGIGLSGSKLLLIFSILCTKNSLNVSERDSGEIFEGSIVSPNLPVIWLLRRKSSRELPQFNIL